MGTGALARPARAGSARAVASETADLPIRIIAGGTDLIPSMRQKLFEPEYVLDLRGIAELRGIKPAARTAVSKSER